MNTSLKRLALPLASAGIVALVLPWSSASAGEKPAFSGYNTSAWAAPVMIELYEPTIPTFTSPQAELELAYTRVEAETGIARGRGSWAWPGDGVGEGFKTIADALGLPPEVGKQGYPFQVNSEHPSGESEQKDEPFPGMVMRTSADGERVSAEVGYSPDGEADEPKSSDGGGDQPEAPGTPGLPTDQLSDFGSAVTGSSRSGEGTAATPLLPPELAALVDFTAYSSTSSADTGTDLVSTESRSVVSDVSLIGGLVVLEGVTAEMLTTSNGKQGTAEGGRELGTMTIAGNEFTVGPDGVQAGGENAAIPGLPDDPGKALAELGLAFSVAKPQEQSSGDKASGLATGVVVEIDTTKLRSQLRNVPLDDIVGAIPDETGELKSLIGAAANLSPRIVLTLGNAGTETDTVQGLT
ncbi:MAG: choice-of-anchor P family protein, partial [Nocardioides sp.]